MALPVITACLVYRAPVSEVVAVPPAAPSTVIQGISLRGDSVPTWIERLEPLTLPLWSVGVLFFSLRLVWGCWRVSAMRRRGRPADGEILSMVAELGSRMGLMRPVRVLTAALPDGPSVAGWLRPVLLLPPAAILGLTPQQLEAVLAHELAHIRRYDHFVNAVQSLVETLLFYHPAVWWTSARVREERELCCDDLAVRACGDALCFARALTTLERLRVMTPSRVLASTGGPLMYRVQRLLGVEHHECAPSKLSGMLAFSLALLCLALNVHWAHAQSVNLTKGVLTITTDLPVDGDAPGVTVDLAGAALLHRPPVGYPESAVINRIQGTVVAQVTLDSTGNVSDAHVVSGPLELRKTVMQSIFEWHFAQDAAGGVRTVNVNFQVPALDGKRMVSVPGVVVGVDSGPQPLAVDASGNLYRADPAARPNTGMGLAVGGSPEQGQVVTDTGRVLIWNHMANSNVPVTTVTQDGEPSSRTTYIADTNGPQEPRFKLRQFTPPNTVRAGDEESLKQLDSPAGRTLTKIETSNLPDSVRNDLLSRLPVHTGDALTSTSMKAVGDVIHKFDEHLIWRVMLGPNSTVIHIESPGGVVWAGK